MPTLKISLDEETYARLTESALRELRPQTWHAFVLLRRALGLPFPGPAETEEPKLQTAPEAGA